MSTKEQELSNKLHYWELPSCAILLVFLMTSEVTYFLTKKKRFPASAMYSSRRTLKTQDINFGFQRNLTRKSDRYGAKTHPFVDRWH